MENISVILPSDLVERAMQATGKRTAKAAFTALVESRKPNAATKRSLRANERELKAGKGKSFTNGKDALAWLKSQ